MRCLFKLMMSAVVFCGPSIPAYALDLAQTWQLALAHDATYASARAQYRATQQKQPQARAGLLPSIEGSVSGTHHDSRATGGLNQVYKQDRTVWSLTLTQPVFNWSALQTYEQSKLVVASGEVLLQLAYQDLLVRVSQAYFDVLTAQDTLAALRAEQQSVQEQLSSSRQRFELGEATVTDALEAQARFDLVGANILAAQNDLENTQNTLARIIGRQPEPNSLFPLPYNIKLPAPVPDKLADWSEQASLANLDVVRASIQTRIAERDTQIAKSGHYPTLNLTASTSSNSAGNAQARQLYGGRTIDNSVGLTLSVPIYQGGRINATVLEKSELQQKSVYDLEGTRRRAVQLSREYFNGVKTGLARVRGLQAAEKSSLSALQANLTGYQIGVRINLDVLNAQQQLFVTKRDLARARYQTVMDGLRLRANSGVLSEADLLSINRLLKAPGSPATGIMHGLNLPRKLR